MIRVITMATTKQSKQPAKRGRPSRRPQIVAATEKLIRTRGLASATTKAIAAAAGCSEGALYVHFNSRSELLLAVLEESLPDMLTPLRALNEAAGRATPRENLQQALTAIFAFHQRVMPSVCSLFSEPDLLADYRRTLTAQNKGPHGAIARLRKYITAEQKLGRISRNVDAEIAATTLMANSFFRSFVGQFFGEQQPFEPFCRRLIAEVIAG
jgi:AcrR family transcriptional regulator